MDMFTLPYLKWITNKDIQYSTWNSVQGYMAAWIGGYLRGDFATLWAVACEAPVSMGFSRQEYWNGLPLPPPGDLPDPAYPFCTC